MHIIDCLPLLVLVPGRRTVLSIKQSTQQGQVPAGAALL